jgi:hypothetical protein
MNTKNIVSMMPALPGTVLVWAERSRTTVSATPERTWQTPVLGWATVRTQGVDCFYEHILPLVPLHGHLVTSERYEAEASLDHDWRVVSMLLNGTEVGKLP